MDSSSDTEIRRLTGYVVSVDPKITVIPEFLSADECEYLITLAERSGFTQSLVGRGTSSEYESVKSHALSNQTSANRTSMSVTLCMDDTDPIMRSVESRLGQVVNLPVSQLESLVVVKYNPGQFFKRHHDGSFRLYTVFLYLNQVPEGGETRFEQLNLRIRPCRGTAVVWGNTRISESGQTVADDRMVHEALPPAGCVKYGMNCFFNESQIRGS